MSDQKKIIERLVKVKYLFIKGRESLNTYGPCSSGLSVSSLQDCIEMLLRLIIDVRHIQITQTENFHSLIQKINQSISPENLKYHTTLNRLNSARVGFKHMGNEPDKNDVYGFYQDMEQLLLFASDNYLNVDFTNISMVDLIGHTRTTNWLKKAEYQLSEQKFIDSATSSACAFAVFRKFIDGDYHLNRKILSTRLDIDRGLTELLHKMEQDVQTHADLLDALKFGISMPDYVKFTKLTPSVDFMAAGNIHISKLRIRTVPLEKEAQFCIRFVLDSALIILNNNAYLVKPSMNVDQKIKVIKDCSMLIAPRDDQEVLLNISGRDALIFDSIKSKSRNGYTNVFYQGDNAYIPNDSVEILDK